MVQRRERRGGKDALILGTQKGFFVEKKADCIIEGEENAP